MVSFIGVDQYTDLAEIPKLVASCSMPLEFGILYSVDRAGHQNRYPSWTTCEEILKYLRAHNVVTSIHLCGKPAIEKYLNADPQYVDLCQHSPVQLNFKMADYDPEILLPRLAEAITKFRGPVVLQYNESKIKFMDMILNSPLVDRIIVLHDASGGFGHKIEQVMSPFTKCLTGYAGGIGPDTVEEIVKIIDHANPENLPYYIDMESGVRIDDRFSIQQLDNLLRAYPQSH